MITQPLVSVIMCVYNAGDYLRPAIASVLGQTYRHLELIIVDDGSTDGCMERVADLFADPRVRPIRQANAGKPTAMNVALGQMNGNFYALNDADDLSHPRRIERQLKCMLENPNVAAVYCGHELILGGRHMAPTFHAKDEAACSKEIVAFCMPAHDPTGMYRMSMVGHLRYEEDLPIVEGFDYMLRVGERWPVLVVGECLYTYRIHWESVTKKNPKLRDELVWKVLRRACKRRGEDFERRFPPATRRNGSRNAERDNGIAAHFMESVCDLKRARNRWQAIQIGFECARLHPLDVHYLKALIYAATPSSLVTASRRQG